MPPRLSPAPAQGSFYPSNDAATYRDLLLFEERLKTNVASLNRRKHRYQIFLVHLMLLIAFLLSEVVLQTRFLLVPYTFGLQEALLDVHTDDVDTVLHTYFASGLLFVSVTTLVLFFASGMYSEKIGYANRYVPHANRALRNFNMYLNVRQPPLQSKIPFNPFAFLFPRPPSRVTSPNPPPSRGSRSPSLSRSPSKRSSSVPIPPIPPASNPRGELIFSSRVDRAFRESYERYRSAFERRREERERVIYSRRWIGWLYMRLLWIRKPPQVSSPAPGTATPVGSAGPGISPSPSGLSKGRGTGSVGSTPSSSRRSSPVPSRRQRRGSAVMSGISRGPAQHPLASETVTYENGV